MRYDSHETNEDCAGENDDCQENNKKNYCAPLTETTVNGGGLTKSTPMVLM